MFVAKHDRDARGKSGGDRAGNEDEKAAGQCALASESVADRASGDDHAGKYDHVRVDDLQQLVCSSFSSVAAVSARVSSSVAVS